MSKRRDPHKQRKANELAKHNKKQAEQSAKRQSGIEEFRRSRDLNLNYHNRNREIFGFREPVLTSPFMDDFFHPARLFSPLTLIVEDVENYQKKKAHKKLYDNTIEHDPNEIPNAKTFIEDLSKKSLP